MAANLKSLWGHHEMMKTRACWGHPHPSCATAARPTSKQPQQESLHAFMWQSTNKAWEEETQPCRGTGPHFPPWGQPLTQRLSHPHVSLSPFPISTHWWGALSLLQHRSAPQLTLQPHHEHLDRNGSFSCEAVTLSKLPNNQFLFTYEQYHKCIYVNSVPQ